MNRASPVDMRKALEVVEELKRAGILFVPIPVKNAVDQALLLSTLVDRLQEIEAEAKA